VHRLGRRRFPDGEHPPAGGGQDDRRHVVGVMSDNSIDASARPYLDTSGALP